MLFVNCSQGSAISRILSIISWILSAIYTVNCNITNPQCINQCCCPPLASLQWIAIAIWIFVFCKLCCLLHVLRFIAFSVFFMLSVRPLCSIVFLPFLAILTDLILFFMYPTNTELLFTVKPFYLSLPLFIPPHSVVLCALWSIHEMGGGFPFWSVGKCITV